MRLAGLTVLLLLSACGIRLETDAAKGSHARTIMRNLSMAVEMYSISNRGALPGSLEDLTKKDPRSDVAYFDRVPVDPWGQVYKLEHGEAGAYRILSAGPDGAFATDDDLVMNLPEDGPMERWR